MIDPFKWQGFVTPENREEIAEALRLRLAGRFDVVQGRVFHKNICLVEGNAIAVLGDTLGSGSGISILHNYGIYTIGEEKSEEIHRHYYLAARGEDTRGDYITFDTNTIHIQPDGSQYYVYIPREEVQ